LTTFFQTNLQNPLPVKFSLHISFTPIFAIEKKL